MAQSDRPPLDFSTHTNLLTDSNLVTIVFIAFVGPMSVNVVAPALPSMADSLQVPDAQIGLVITAITFPAIFFTPIVGVIGDLYGRRQIVLPALFLFGAAGSAIYFVDNFLIILILRGLQGMAMAVIPPVSVTLLGDLYSGPTGSTAQGLRSSMNGLSSSLVPIIAGFLAVIAWNVPFLLYGFSFLVLILAYLYCPETSKRLNAKTGVVSELQSYRQAVQNEITDVRLIILVLGGAVRFFSLFAQITFIPLFAVRVLGATAFQVGLILALRALRIIVSPLIGFIIVRTSRFRTIVAAQLTIILSIGLTPFAPNLIWLGVLVSVFSIGDAVFGPTINDTVASTVDAENRNGIISLMRSLKEIGKTTAPILLGVVLVAGGFKAVFFATAFLSVLYVTGLALVGTR